MSTYEPKNMLDGTTSSLHYSSIDLIYFQVESEDAPNSLAEYVYTYIADIVVRVVDLFFPFQPAYVIYMGAGVASTAYN